MFSDLKAPTISDPVCVAQRLIKRKWFLTPSAAALSLHVQNKP